MTIIKEGKLVFDFPPSFKAVKYDETDYYRKHFTGIQDELKAIDILAIEDKTNYMIEVKDYRHPKTKNLTLSCLINNIVKKIICSLSAIYPMSLNASIQGERSIAKSFLENNKLVIILHLERSPTKKKMAKSCWKRADIKKKLRRRLKPITNKIKVVSMAEMIKTGKLTWNVS